jgi:hypothetical protein
MTRDQAATNMPVLCRGHSMCGHRLPSLRPRVFQAPHSRRTNDTPGRRQLAPRLVVKLGVAVIFLVIFPCRRQQACTDLGTALACAVGWVVAGGKVNRDAPVAGGIAALTGRRPGWSILVGIAIALGVSSGLSTAISQGRQKATAARHREESNRKAEAARAKALAEVPAKMAERGVLQRAGSAGWNGNQSSAARLPGPLKPAPPWSEVADRTKTEEQRPAEAARWSPIAKSATRRWAIADA